MPKGRYWGSIAPNRVFTLSNLNSVYLISIKIQLYTAYRKYAAICIMYVFNVKEKCLECEVQ